MYYNDKIEILKDIFGTNKINLGENYIDINNIKYSIFNDIIYLDKKIIGDIEKQSTIKTFGQEWKEFNKISSEHYSEFEQYFDLIKINNLENKIVADFGCGIGRWSKILIDKINLKNLILYDYSEAIEVARENFREYKNIIFIKGDIEKIPFKKNSIDFFICLGVIHHLANEENISMQKITECCSEGIVYLYYDLEFRSFVYKLTFNLSDIIRKFFSKSNNKNLNIILSYFLTIFIYYPFISLGNLFHILRISNNGVPLSFYRGFSFVRIRQDAYDRFFTNIEKRISKKNIIKRYSKFYKNIEISNKPPYWHFYLTK